MKRRLLTLGLLLLAGAIINVAVAWWCAACGPSDVRATSVRDLAWLDHPPSGFPPHASSWSSLAKFGLLCEVQSAYTVDQQEFERIQSLIRSIQSSSSSHASRTEVNERVNDGLAPLQLGIHPGNFFHTRISTGWPLLSFEGGLWHWVLLTPKPQEHFRLAHAIDLDDLRIVKGPLGSGNRIIPIQPLCLGFAINTMFYAAIVWLLFFAPLQLRRWRRIKRGLCPACAYPIGSSEVCTECGQPLPRRVHR